MGDAAMPNSNPEHARYGWFARAYLTRRYAVLFYSLLATLAAGPLFDAFGFDANLLEAFLAVNLLAAVIPSASDRRRRDLLVLFIVAVSARYGAAWMSMPAISMAGMALWAGVALAAAARAVRFAVRANSITGEHLYAALDAYLLAGIFIGVLYWTLENVSPGSLQFVSDQGPSDFSILSAMYFSFVTLATLGYGDVLPHSEAARGIAIVEAVAGQLFLAVMIARLVSIYARTTKFDDGE
jgi:hypothetical protein